MDNKYYTVDKVSKIIGMHPKTIRRFIREGKLRANKVGKEWRISGHDLSLFVEGSDKVYSSDSNIDSEEKRQENKADRVKVSAVADIDVIDIDEAMRIASTLSALMNSKDRSYGKSTIKTQYIESEMKIRVMLWGTPSFIEVIMGSLNVLLDN